MGFRRSRFFRTCGGPSKAIHRHLGVLFRFLPDSTRSIKDSWDSAEIFDHSLFRRFFRRFRNRRPVVSRRARSMFWGGPLGFSRYRQKFRFPSGTLSLFSSFFASSDPATPSHATAGLRRGRVRGRGVSRGGGEGRWPG